MITAEFRNGKAYIAMGGYAVEGTYTIHVLSMLWPQPMSMVSPAKIRKICTARFENLVMTFRLLSCVGKSSAYSAMREMRRKTVMAWKTEKQEQKAGDEAETKSRGLEDQTTWAKTKADNSPEIYAHGCAYRLVGGTKLRRGGAFVGVECAVG